MKKIYLMIIGCAIIVVLGYGINDYYNNKGDGMDNMSDEASVPFFKIQDLRGIEHRLSDYDGGPVLVHFMSISCGGEYTKLNDNQLKQLKLVCSSLCETQDVTIFTVLVSTCETTDLSKLYDMYNITWILGNDYQDSKLDVLAAFSEYEPIDGMILILNKDLAVNQVLNSTVSAESLVEEILALGA